MERPNKITQCDRILQFIREFGYITSWQAYKELGVTQLSARITDLKDKGYCFQTKCIKTRNRFGDPTHYYEYTLVDCEV